MLEYKLEALCKSELPLVIQKLRKPYSHRIHQHNAVELVYIEHGAGWCAVNGIIHPMLTGDLYIIPVGATHEYYSEQNLQYTNILFNKSLFLENEQDLYWKFSGQGADKMPDKYTFGPHLQKMIVSRIDELNGELVSGESHSLLRSRILFLELLIFIIRNAEHAPGVLASCAQLHLGRVLSYITDHLGAKLSLEHLASISGYRPDYFGKLFRREIGLGVSEYICNRRIECACYELEYSSRTVDEIAVETGFFDTSYFIKMFKRYCGCTPLQYRRKHKTNVPAEPAR